MTLMKIYLVKIKYKQPKIQNINQNIHFRDQ